MTIIDVDATLELPASTCKRRKAAIRRISSNTISLFIYILKSNMKLKVMIPEQCVEKGDLCGRLGGSCCDGLMCVAENKQWVCDKRYNELIAVIMATQFKKIKGRVAHYPYARLPPTL